MRREFRVRTFETLFTAIILINKLSMCTYPMAGLSNNKNNGIGIFPIQLYFCEWKTKYEHTKNNNTSYYMGNCVNHYLFEHESEWWHFELQSTLSLLHLHKFVWHFLMQFQKLLAPEDRVSASNLTLRKFNPWDVFNFQECVFTCLNLTSPI